MKQRASQIPPPQVNTSPSLAPGAAATHTLASLTQRLGTATRVQIVAYVALAPIATFVDEGTRVSTARVVEEGTRIVGLAVEVLDRADAEQRALMPALDEAMLCACTSALATCGAIDVARASVTSKNSGQAKQRKSARGALAGQAATRRTILYTAAISLAAADPGRRVELDDAWGSGDDPSHLATSLSSLVTIARAIVADAKKRGVTVSLTDAWLDEQAALATKLLKATQRVGRGVVEGQVAQGDVAWWRGIALWFLKQIADTISVARKSDPRIREIPLGSLRAALKRSGKPTRKAEPVTPVTPVTPAKPV